MVSIIVPVYKVEQYLDRCVQSILSQTYKDYELILVDDGSPDNCPAMCDAYAAKYENICVLHKKNGGLSDARNAGTAIANGKYVTYVDSDDYIHSLYLEMLVTALKTTQSNIAVVEYQKVYDKNGIEHLKKDDIKLEKLSSIVALEKILYQKFHDVSAWGILLPLKLAREYPYPVGRLFEDTYTTYNYYLQSKQIAFVHAGLYYYCQRKDSIMKNRSDKFVIDLFEGSELLLQHCSFDANLKKAAESKCFSNYCRIITLVPDLQQRFPEIYEQIRRFLLDNRLGVLFNLQTRLKNKIAAIFLLGGIGSLRWIYSLKK